jgi:hypothetical protein
MAHSSKHSASAAAFPDPPSERGPWLLAIALGALGVGVLAAALTGLIGGDSSERPPAPPPVLVAAATPIPGPAAAASVLSGHATLGAPAARAATRLPSAHRSEARAASRRHGRTHANASTDVAHGSLGTAGVPPSAALTRLADQTEVAVPAGWIEGFYPIYGVAQSTFAVNWLLLASIHEQESAFSTAPGTYHGLNFAGCCGGPMQFNVTNGPVSTWQLVSNSYIYGKRPAAYDHPTATHPSIYDDFDAIMAAAHLLSADGATVSLDAGAWDAAYAYYGHDANGVAYADRVLARAIGWSQHGFCANCGIEQSLVTAVHAAYGAPVLAALTMATAARARK